jgi:DHA1 family tetracycline resistance protein-like MFS transporter
LYGLAVPVYFAASLAFANVIFGYFVLPESLSQENRRPFDWKRANPIGTFINLKLHKEIIWLIVVVFLLNIAGQSPQSTWTYYTILKFDWSTKMVGASLAFIGLSIAIVQGGLIRVIVPKLGQEKSVFLGFAFSLLGYILFAFATKGWMMFAFMVPFAIGGIAMPAIQGIISNRVPANEQGELQGALTSLMSVTSIIGPVMMNGLFAYFTSSDAPIYLPGASFYLAAVFTLIAIFFAYKTLSTRLNIDA